MNKIFYVYAYIRSKSSKYGAKGTPYYIGKGKNDRAFAKKHSVNPPPSTSSILFLAENLSENDAYQQEMFLIYLHGRVDTATGCLRNHTDGGEGRRKSIISVETRKKLADARKGKVVPEDIRRKISESEKGKIVTEETKKKIKAARATQIVTIETKKKMSSSAKGKTKSSLHRNRISSSLKNIEKIKCVYCDGLFPPASFGRYHNTKCKLYKV